MLCQFWCFRFKHNIARQTMINRKIDAVSNHQSTDHSIFLIAAIKNRIGFWMCLHIYNMDNQRTLQNLVGT